ncbi:MAG: hypothetical protein AAAC47_08655 [Pararhizobium sp.]
MSKLTLEMMRQAMKEARQRAVPTFMVNGAEQYIYFPEQKRWACALDNIKAS